MTRDEVAEIVWRTLDSMGFGISWKESDKLGELNSDSLDVVDFAFSIEEETGVHIAEDQLEKELSKDSTIWELINFLHNLTNK